MNSRDPRSIRRRTAAFAPAFVGMLLLSYALRIESWPFSSYPMYSLPKTIEQVAFARFAFEGAGGERRFWRPRIPYLAKDLNGLIRRERGRPDFEATLRAAARLVLADLRHDESAGRVAAVERVLVVERRVDRRGGGFEPVERVLAAFEVEALR